MKKLKLEDLEITSFQTEPNAPQVRGTLKGHQILSPPSFLQPCYETDANFDCTYGCSHDTGCDDTCVVSRDCP